jgi:hypothetical protein
MMDMPSPQVFKVSGTARATAPSRAPASILAQAQVAPASEPDAGISTHTDYSRSDFVAPSSTPPRAEYFSVMM